MADKIPNAWPPNDHKTAAQAWSRCGCDNAGMPTQSTLQHARQGSYDGGGLRDRHGARTKARRCQRNASSGHEADTGRAGKRHTHPSLALGSRRAGRPALALAPGCWPGSRRRAWRALRTPALQGRQAEVGLPGSAPRAPPPPYKRATIPPGTPPPAVLPPRPDPGPCPSLSTKLHPTTPPALCCRAVPAT